MRLVLYLINLNLAFSFNISDTTYKIKYLLNYKSTSRCRRCVDLNKLGRFVGKTVNFFEETERYGTFLKSFNVSECEDKDNPNYTFKHILDGLLLHENVPDTHWYEYKSVFNKKYQSERHEMAALRKWRQNLQRVARHNQQYLAGKHSYSLHLNQFGDMHVAEYFKNVLKLFDTIPLFDPAEDPHKTTYYRTIKQKIPKQVDWRTHGFRPKLEEQWQCGACYAFAVTHAIQAQLFKKHGDWSELSPQQIVDCSYADGNMGCDGGSLKAALRYATRSGLITEKLYPYIGKKGFCKYSSMFIRAKPKRWATLPAGDEKAIERAIATIGPLAVGVNAAPFTFQLYKSGIYDDIFCNGWTMNHAMLLVGYTPQYWILLNWWGKNWGEQGYMRIRRGFNQCGIANMATYVEL